MVRSLTETSCAICLALVFWAVPAGAETAKLGQTTANVNFREGPNRSAPVIGVLKPGTEVQILKRLPNGWCLIAYRGRPGFVHGHYLEDAGHMEISRFARATVTVLMHKESGITIGVIVSVILIWRLRRRSGFKTLCKTAALLIACALLVPVTDIAFKLGLLYSLMFVSLGLLILTVSLILGRKPSLEPGSGKLRRI